jgi:hypothetical protein
MALARESNANRSLVVDAEEPPASSASSRSLARIIIVAQSANNGAHTFCAWFA